MKKRLLRSFPVFCAVLLIAADQSKIPPMPDAATGNAVASLRNGFEVYSLLGISTKKTWGGIADETIIYVDGAKKEGTGFVASDECWMGKIDKKDPNKIEWSKLPPHPGPGRFGIVASGWEREHRVMFSGGTLVPHDFKGLAA